MPHPIVEIDELVRLVIDELVETNLRSAVSFALTCRFLEEPALSSVWKRQESFDDLLKVLPSFSRAEKGDKDIVSVRGFPAYHARYQFP